MYSPFDIYIYDALLLWRPMGRLQTYIYIYKTEEQNEQHSSCIRKDCLITITHFRMANAGRKNCCTFWRSADYWSCQAAVWLRTNKRHSKEKDSNKQHICIDHLSRPMAGELKRCLVPSCREVEQYAKKEDQNTQEARNNALFESDNAKHEQIFSGNTFLR